LLTFMFSAEEINLMCIFDNSSKDKLLAELRESKSYVYEPDMRDIYDNTIEKLEKISDEDFSEIGLYIADEYADGEEW